MKSIIKAIYTQDENGKGLYAVETFGEVSSIEATIPCAYVGMEIIINDENGKVIVTPTGKNQGLSNFLIDNISGIGPAKTQHVSLDLYNAILNENVIYVCGTLGVKEDKAKEIIAFAKGNRTILELYIITNGVCSKNKIHKIYETYGNRSCNLLRNNPYKLTEMCGIGFLEADKIACSTGIAKDSFIRISSAINYILFTAAFSNGHCYLTKEQLKEELINLLVDIPKSAGKAKEKACLNAIFDWENKKEKFIKTYKPMDEEIIYMDCAVSQINALEKNINGGIEYAIHNYQCVREDNRLYVPAIYKAEVSSSNTVLKMIQNSKDYVFSDDEIKKALKEVENRKTEELRANGKGAFCATEEQLEAVYLAVQNRFSIISGGPGRGKTAIAEIIAQIYKNKYGNDAVLMMAPTGRAAQRITESTGYKATTIHYAITQPKTNNKLIIADESSMIDILLFSKFMEWAEQNSILLLGDVNQIASVGPGQVLRDLINCGNIPYIKLNKGHRNSGSIANNSDLINAGKPIYSYEFDNAFMYKPASRESISNTFLDYFDDAVKEFGIKNVMAITPSKRGVLSVETLNKVIQKHYSDKNVSLQVSPDVIFHLGDRVMQTKNNRDFPLMLPDRTKGYGIFNGERGTIIKIEKDKGLFVQFDDGKIGAYKKETARELTLSYVMTIHKCQGSESPCVLMGMTFQDAFLINRNLFYTGETRAKKKIILIGEQKKSKRGNYMQSAFDLAVYKTNDKERQTTLSKRCSK